MVAGGCSGIAALATVVAQAATEPSPAIDVAVVLSSCLWVPGFVSLLTLVPLLYPTDCSRRAGRPRPPSSGSRS